MSTAVRFEPGKGKIGTKNSVHTSNMSAATSQDGAHEGARPYRSHLKPACIPCKKRKSRCQNDNSSTACLMCRNHRTECIFPNENTLNAGKTRVSPSESLSPSSSRRRRPRERGSISSRTSLPTARDSPSSIIHGQVSVEGNNEVNQIMRSHRHDGSTTAATRLPESSVLSAPAHPNLRPHGVSNNNLSMNSGRTADNRIQPPPLVAANSNDTQDSSGSRSLSLRSREDEHLNLHIVGPAGTNDSQIVSDYLSGLPDSSSRNTKIVRPAPVTRQSRPVLFTMVQKRPVGVTVKSSPSAEKLEMIEKLIEPHAENLINE